MFITYYSNVILGMSTFVELLINIIECGRKLLGRVGGLLEEENKKGIV